MSQFINYTKQIKIKDTQMHNLSLSQDHILEYYMFYMSKGHI